MQRKILNALYGLDIPDLYELVFSSGGDPLAIGGGLHAGDCVFVTFVGVAAFF